MTNQNRILIIGGGQTAAYAAKTIRENSESSKITIFSEENFFPYEKPPLSKDYLKGDRDFEKLFFFEQKFYKDNKIDFINNKRIKSVNFEDKKIFSEDNENYIYDKLLLANGASNRKIDIPELENDKNIVYLRNKNECDDLKKKICNANEILIIGGGFIGLEVAASIKSANNVVHIIEMNENLMGRIIPKNISDIVFKIHEERGNKIYLKTKIKQIQKKDSYYDVILSNNVNLKIDLIIVGIGSVPNTEIFRGTNLKINNGVETNNYCETSITDVYAAGDVSNFFHPVYNKHIRLESYTHAQNQGISAGKNIVGIKTSYEDIPWMWSDQFDFNIQLTGICDDYDTVIKRGDNEDEGIVLFFIKNEFIVGACGIGKKGKIGKDIKIASRVADKKIKINKDIISDKSFKLNKLLR